MKFIIAIVAAVPMILAASAAKAFIVFAPAAFAGVVIGSIAFGWLTSAMFGHPLIQPWTPWVAPQPVIEQPVVLPPKRPRYHVVYHREY